MIADSPSDACCCGHQAFMHLYSAGMCRLCKRACEKFHAPGDGHVWANVVLVALVIAVVAAVCAGAWAAYKFIMYGGFVWKF